MEKWKSIENSLYYAVSNKGRIKRLEHKRWCKPNQSYSTIKEKILSLSNNNTKKYWRVRIYYENGGHTEEAVHRLVAKAFIPNPKNLPQVNHIDGNRNNNNVENLEWCDQSYNMKHSINLGLREEMYSKNRGEKCSFNKYPKELILKIPNLVNKGYSYKEVAKILNIPTTLITEIKSKRAWKHLNLTIPDSKFCRKKI